MRFKKISALKNLVPKNLKFMTETQDSSSGCGNFLQTGSEFSQIVRTFKKKTTCRNPKSKSMHESGILKESI